MPAHIEKAPETLRALLADMGLDYVVKRFYKHQKTHARIEVYDRNGSLILRHDYMRGSPTWRTSDESLATAHRDGKKYAAICEIIEKLRVSPNTQTQKPM